MEFSVFVLVFFAKTFTSIWNVAPSSVKNSKVKSFGGFSAKLNWAAFSVSKKLKGKFELKIGNVESLKILIS